MYKEAWKRWGDLQWVMIMEECSELIQATSKRLRKGDTPKVRQMLAEEVADVEIMLEQLKTVDPYLAVASQVFKQRKLERLGKMLKNVISKGE